MSGIIICIHGLRNKPEEKLLSNWWKRSIIDGLTINGCSTKDFKFKLVYWANYLHQEPLRVDEKDRKSPLYIENPYLPFSGYTHHKAGLRKQHWLDNLEEKMDNILFDHPNADRFNWLEDKVICHLFPELYNYYYYPDENLKSIKKILREKLFKTIKKHRRKKIMLISHSMGSIIAYDVLAGLCSTRRTPVHTFITIGSPLGLPVIMKKIGAEHYRELNEYRQLPTPETIRNKWYNFSDLEDKIAINYDLGDDYTENSGSVKPVDVIVQNMYINNGKRNPHSIYGYLRTRELASAVCQFLTESEPIRKRITRFCRL